MKKLKVNTEGCIGCGACVGLDPKHFDFNEEGLSVVISEENINPEKIQTVIESCPVSVISYEEDERNACSCRECHCEEPCECEDHCECEKHCGCHEDDEKAA